MSAPCIENVIDTSILAQDLQSTYGLSPQKWESLELNRRGTSLDHDQLYKKGVPNPRVGFQWQSDDGTIEYWCPQGITGLRNEEEKKVIVVSWNSKSQNPSNGVRLSFADVTHLREERGLAVPYHHVLLVVPSQSAGFNLFQPIHIPAGGLATRENMIFVVDKYKGIRAFDATQIFAAEEDESESKCGMIDSKAYAFNCRYLLPQTALYEMTMGGQHFSSASMDWSNPERPLLTTGNYHSSVNPSSDNPPPKITWWTMEDMTISGYDRTVETDITNMQGSISYSGCLWLSQRGGASKFKEEGRLRVARVTNKTLVSSWKDYDWPWGCRDLHLFPYSHNMWCHTKNTEGNGRFVFAARLIDFGP